MADNWLVAEEPLHNLPGAVDSVHWNRSANREAARLEGDALRRYITNRRKGTGLGLPFAVEMVRRTGVPIGLLPCAHGGTSMAQWDPALKDRGGDSLYGGMLRRVRAVGGKVKGLLWYQGESETNPQAATVFFENFKGLVAAIREDFGQPDLPFYYVQIGRYVNDDNAGYWNTIQELQRQAEAAIPASAMAAAIDLPLDDGIHLSSAAHKRMGVRMANLARGLPRGPRPVSAALLPNNILRVTYSDVNGGLEAPGLIAGFSIHAATGEPVPLIFKSLIDPQDRNAVLLYLDRRLPDGAVLDYGYGNTPLQPARFGRYGGSGFRPHGNPAMNRRTGARWAVERCSPRDSATDSAPLPEIHTCHGRVGRRITPSGPMARPGMRASFPSRCGCRTPRRQRNTEHRREPVHRPLARPDRSTTGLSHAGGHAGHGGPAAKRNLQSEWRHHPRLDF